MTDTPSPRLRRSSLSPAARSLRLQRARLQDGASYADIAAEEGFSRERLRQIVRAATAPGCGHGGPGHARAFRRMENTFSTILYLRKYNSSLFLKCARGRSARAATQLTAAGKEKR